MGLGFCFELALGFLSSASLSDSVSIYFFDLLMVGFAMGLAVADFLGTTLGLD